MKKAKLLNKKNQKKNNFHFQLIIKFAYLKFLFFLKRKNFLKFYKSYKKIKNKKKYIQFILFNYS